MKKIALLTIVLLAGIYACAQETYLYAKKDTSVLYMDIRRPAATAETTISGVSKPTVLFLFGGGFISGTRRDEYLVKWFNILNENGYTVVAIDYRLGMKGYKMGKGLSGLAKSVNRFYTSQQMGVEDVFSAVSYLAAHPELGIDIHNIVLSGNSAGAIISLAAARALTNGERFAIPQDFRFKGIISFSGGIISTKGAPFFDQAPCPILFFHGMNDKAVAYKHFGAFGKGVWGSSFLAERMKKKGYPYCIYRFHDRAHDVAAYMSLLWPEEQAFLEINCMQGVERVIDAQITNPALPVWKNWGELTPQQMYNGQ